MYAEVWRDGYTRPVETAMAEVSAFTAPAESSTTY
jgi:hypothetical protein